MAFERRRRGGLWMKRLCVVCGFSFEKANKKGPSPKTCSVLCFREHRLARARIRYPSIRKKNSDRSKRYYKANRKRLLEARKKKRVENLEAFRERERLLYQANAERIRARKKKWRRENPEKVREIRRKCNAAFFNEHPEQCRAVVRADGRKRSLAFKIARSLAPSVFKNIADSKQRTAALHFCKRFNIPLEATP